jgi:hypothetical protein
MLFALRKDGQASRGERESFLTFPRFYRRPLQRVTARSRRRAPRTAQRTRDAGHVHPIPPGPAGRARGGKLRGDGAAYDTNARGVAEHAAGGERHEAVPLASTGGVVDDSMAGREGAARSGRTHRRAWRRRRSGRGRG